MFYFFRFASISDIQYFYIDIDFIIAVVYFYEIETIPLNITCQLISLFAVKEMYKVNSAICSTFQTPFQSTTYYL